MKEELVNYPEELQIPCILRLFFCKFRQVFSDLYYLARLSCVASTLVLHKGYKDVPLKILVLQDLPSLCVCVCGQHVPEPSNYMQISSFSWGMFVNKYGVCARTSVQPSQPVFGDSQSVS